MHVYLQQSLSTLAGIDDLQAAAGEDTMAVEVNELPSASDDEDEAEALQPMLTPLLS